MLPSELLNWHKYWPCASQVLQELICHTSISQHHDSTAIKMYESSNKTPSVIDSGTRAPKMKRQPPAVPLVHQLSHRSHSGAHVGGRRRSRRRGRQAHQRAAHCRAPTTNFNAEAQRRFVPWQHFCAPTDAILFFACVSIVQHTLRHSRF